MKRTISILLVATAAAFASVNAFAHEFKIGEIEIGHPYSRAMLPGAKVGGGYLKLVNNGADDRLIGITSDRAASVQLHEMKIDNGVMVMRELKDGIDVPANTTVELKPGGYHVMFMNVIQPFKEHEMVKATLTFEKAGKVDVEFMVGPAAGGASASEHEGHSQ